MEDKTKLLEFARLLPKVELHVHLEGSILPATLMTIAERNGVKLPVANLKELEDMFVFRGFEDFIKVYMMITGSMRTEDDFTLIAYEFGHQMNKQNCMYAEVTFTIASNTHYTGLDWRSIVRALNVGRTRAHTEFGVNWGWVFDIARDFGDTQGFTTDVTIAALKEGDLGVLALGLGGTESKFPPALFVSSFEKAHCAGVKSVPHGGELAGPDSVWDCLRLLHADRIGHGVRCVEDPALLKHIIDEKICLETCPWSNILLRVYPSFMEHPLRVLWDKGALLTVNSDDPALFGKTLCDQYELLVTDFSFSAEELQKISLNGIHASFLSNEDKDNMTAKFQERFKALRLELNL